MASNTPVSRAAALQISTSLSNGSTCEAKRSCRAARETDIGKTAISCLHRMMNTSFAAWMGAVLLAVAAAPAGAQSEPAESKSAKSADEIARELANPNNSLASLTFKNQYRAYAGTFPRANDQDNYTLLFQPVFPFPLKAPEGGGTANLFVRPAIPLLVDQPTPVVRSGQADFDKTTALGDIGFDIGYGVTEKTGFLWAYGLVGTLPTASRSEVAGKQLRLGPEILLASISKNSLLGIFPSHQWNVAGWGENRAYSTSQLQLFAKYLPGGGWNVGTAPIMNYDWIAEKWNIPLNLSASKTLKIGDTPVKIELEVNYYVERPNEFAPKWMIGLNITPVVHNFVVDWFRHK